MVRLQSPRKSPISGKSIASGSFERPPPIKEITVPKFSVEDEKRPPRLSISSVKYLVYAILAWAAVLVLVISLERAGVTESVTDIRFEEFLTNTGWKSFNVSSYAPQERLRPGYLLAEEGARAKYPVVMVPGFVTSGLELWAGKACARKYFRQRMWGGLGTARQIFTERDCWREHLALDPFTGMDPENIRIRAAQGFEAADYFMANYWVWGKLIENLADIGYDASQMVVESYDWRLAFPLLEERDGYLTRLRHSIEAMHSSRGRKVVIASHSMGSQLLIYFFTWVTTDKSEGGGGGGPNWVDEHVHAFVNIAGPMLGVPKAAPALLSGEMRDTNRFIGVFGSMTEQFFGRRLRKDLWITWGSLWAMLPKGGNAIWGVGADIISNATLLSDEEPYCTEPSNGATPSLVPLLHLTDIMENKSNKDAYHCESDSDDSRQTRFISKEIDVFSHCANHSVEETLDFLRKWGGGHGPSVANARYHSFDKEEQPSSRTWSDPSRTPLPYAPKMKIYCLYGVGLKTERAYFYKRTAVNQEHDVKMCNNSHFDPPLVMDTSVHDEEHDIEHGVILSDGDGSVPLLSLGYLCVDAWKRKELNPSGSKVITREYSNEGEFLVDDPMRGGPRAADHVDILGNVDMTEDFLRIVSDFDSKDMKSLIVSDIENIAKRIDSHPDGGLFRNKKRKNPLGVLWSYL